MKKKLFFFIKQTAIFLGSFIDLNIQIFFKVKTKLVDGQKGHLEPFGRVWTLFGGKSVQRERMKKNWTKPPAASYGRIFKFLVSRIGFWPSTDLGQKPLQKGSKPSKKGPNGLFGHLKAWLGILKKIWMFRSIKLPHKMALQLQKKLFFFLYLDLALV